jgi:hypothetical protein
MRPVDDIDLEALIADVGELQSILESVRGPVSRGDRLRLQEVEVLIAEALLYARNIHRSS